MERRTTDILIAGAGPAGLIAAAAFAKTGASVIVADPAAPPDPEAPDADLRSTAFLRPARELMARIGLWEALEPHATPLETLRIVDLAGDPPALRTARSFSGEGQGPLGWNFLNTVIRRAVTARLEGRVTLLWGTAVTGLVNRTAEARLTLSDGSQVVAALAIAADGAESRLREMAGIAAKTTRYGQKALAFAVTHPVPHDGVSTEFYLDGGPFTMVPLPDRNGSPASAVVWMQDGPDALAARDLPDAAFAEAITARTAATFGPLTPVTRRALWPVVTRRARRLAIGRVALIAEAAHVLPPIGAQGLNTSVADIACLANLLESHEIGSPAMLDAYEAARAPDIAARAAAIDIFNRVTRSPDAVSQALRRLGLTAIHDIVPLRQGIMRAGMGPGA